MNKTIATGTNRHTESYNGYIIDIEESCEQVGYMYSIHRTIEDLENGEDGIDGGLCTTTIENALEMARVQVDDIIAYKNK